MGLNKFKRDLIFLSFSYDVKLLFLGEFTMKKTRLLTKIYADKKNNFLDLKSAINEAIDDLNVQLNSISLSDAGYVSITLEGEDEIVASNYLKTLFGESKELNDLKGGDIIKGYICSSGKVGFGIFVDIGIKEPYQVDALIPLFVLREQLTNSDKVAVRKIIELFGLIDNVPLEVAITEISIGTKKIQAKLSDDQAAKFKQWIEEGLDKLIILGASQNEVEEALDKSKHSHDIIEIENLGWKENILTCKFNTTAKGLIPEIGRNLPKARLEIFSPGRIKRELRNE